MNLMWRILPLILLVSCAASEPPGGASEDRPAGYRIVSIVDVPLNQPSRSNGQQAPVREFQRGDTLGSIRETGAWSIRVAVTHSRLRCATYETGIQFGAGEPDCSGVQWMTNVEFGTRRTQCNNATAVHTGGGEFPATGNLFGSSTCVRVVTTCVGAC
jgi:hypothetical protein